MVVLDVGKIFSLMIKKENGLSIVLSGGLLKRKEDGSGEYGSLERNRRFSWLQCK
jgi:hypothetical protein